jgi:stress-induced morphogen
LVFIVLLPARYSDIALGVYYILDHTPGTSASQFQDLRQMVSLKEIEDKLAAVFCDDSGRTSVVIRDLTGGKDHLEAVIVSNTFTSLNRMQRHRLVYDCLVEEMKGAIHALTLKTLTPEEAGSNR